MQHGAVADRDALADGEGRPGIAVKDAVVLDIAFLADGQRIVVAAQYSAKQDADPLAERHVADDRRVLCHEAGRRNDRPLAVEFIDRHSNPSVSRNAATVPTIGHIAPRKAIPSFAARPAMHNSTPEV